MPAIKFGNAASLLAAAFALSSTSAVLAQEPPLEAQAGRTANFDIPITAAGAGADGVRPPVRHADRRRYGGCRRQDERQRQRHDDGGTGVAPAPRRIGPDVPVHLGQCRHGARVPLAVPGSSAVQLDPVRVQASRTAAAGRDRQPAAGLCRRPGRARRQGRPARQPRLHGHAVQRDDLHREVHAEPAGPHADRRAGRRPDIAVGHPQRQRVRRPRHDPRHHGVQPQFRLRRSLRHRPQSGRHDRHRARRGLPRTDRIPERRIAERGRRHHQPCPQARDGYADHAGHRSLQFGRAARRYRRRRPPLRAGQRDRSARRRHLLFGRHGRQQPGRRTPGADLGFRLP